MAGELTTNRLRIPAAGKNFTDSGADCHARPGEAIVVSFPGGEADGIRCVFFLTARKFNKKTIFDQKMMAKYPLIRHLCIGKMLPNVWKSDVWRGFLRQGYLDF